MDSSSSMNEDSLQNYEIGKILGRGQRYGSETRLATCHKGPLAGKDVVVKIIPRISFDERTDEEKLYKESVQLRRTLHHPAIISYLSAFETSYSLYEVTEYCRGGSLENFMWLSAEQSSRLREDGVGEPYPYGSGVLTEGQIRGVLRAVTEGLIFIHESGLQHSELTLANIFMASGDRIKIGGLDIWKQDRNKLDNVFSDQGTKDAKNSRITHQDEGYCARVDAWTLGHLTMTMLTGHCPPKEPGGIISNTASDKVSPKLHYLISALQRDSHERITLHEILSHSFLDYRLSITPISNTSIPSRNRSWKKRSTPATVSLRHASEALKTPVDNSHLQKDSGAASMRPEQLDELRKITTSSSGRPNSSKDTKPIVTAGRLPPQIIRTQHGTINIQSSGSIIIDLRDGERMKGRKGDFVLEVSSCGEKINIHLAPYVDIPSLLYKPVAKYTATNLPFQFSKAYEFAANYLEMIKHRTPVFTLTTPMGRCSLMANGQKGDIECTYVGPPLVSGASKLYTGNRLRLRLSRDNGTLEISQYRPYSPNSNFRSCRPSSSSRFCKVGGTLAGEWVKQVIPAPPNSYKDLPGLSEEARGAFDHLLECKKICEKVEEALPALQIKVSDRLQAAQSPTRYRQKEQRENKFKPRFFTHPTLVKTSHTNSTHVPLPEPSKTPSPKLSKPMLMGLGLPPRPRRISTSQTTLTDNRTSATRADKPPSLRKRSVHWGADVRDTYEPEYSS